MKGRTNQNSAEGKQVYRELAELEHYLEQADKRDVMQQTRGIRIITT